MKFAIFAGAIAAAFGAYWFYFRPKPGMTDQFTSYAETARDGVVKGYERAREAVGV